MRRTDFTTLRQRLQRLSFDALADRRMGLEKESLRVTQQGRLSPRPHPPALGSALTHPWITTDYSEALIELVSPPVHQPWEAIQFLVDLHQFVYQSIGEEMLWATSMPCAVRSDQDIPIAEYGTSNIGRMKHVYRHGLGHRYGRLMQAISGVHFNYSVGARFWLELLGKREAADAAVVSAWYFGLLRNFRRFGWLVLYLYGASPASCRSFLGAADTDLEEFDSTLFGTYATTLRMSDVGYKNKVQSRLEISVNSLEEYVAGLSAATSTPFPDYEKIGVKVDGEYRQLNANILQIENEYYSLIRPKRVARSGEKPTHALIRGGVEYVELRACDVSPFDPVGISQSQLRFLEVLLLFCLLHDSPPIDDDEQAMINYNQLHVARRGRDPALRLRHPDGETSIPEWGRELAGQLLEVARLCDGGEGDCYQQAIMSQATVLEDPDLTPSARVLRELQEQETSFFEYAINISTMLRSYFLDLASNPARQRQLEDMAQDSIKRQRRLEATDTLSFDQFLEHYFNQTGPASR